MHRVAKGSTEDAGDSRGSDPGRKVIVVRQVIDEVMVEADPALGEPLETGSPGFGARCEGD